MEIWTYVIEVALFPILSKFREIIPTKDQPFKNNDSFKCIDLKL